VIRLSPISGVLHYNFFSGRPGFGISTVHIILKTEQATQGVFFLEGVGER
jgi:hypothetical protein